VKSSTTTVNNELCAVDETMASIDDRAARDDRAPTIVIDQSHSVRSLKKFFETKMIVEGVHVIHPQPPCLQATDTIIEQCNKRLPVGVSDQSASINNNNDNNNVEQRQEIMNKLLDSLKRKTRCSRTTDGK
jgi:arsenate reductase-like glutaredoxin family protein